MFPIIVTQLLGHCPSAIVNSSALENKFILWCDFLVWFRLSISMTRFRFYNSTCLADVICRVIFCLWNIILCSVFTNPLFAFLLGFYHKSASLLSSSRHSQWKRHLSGAAYIYLLFLCTNLCHIWDSSLFHPAETCASLACNQFPLQYVLFSATIHRYLYLYIFILELFSGLIDSVFHNIARTQLIYNFDSTLQ